MRAFTIDTPDTINKALFNGDARKLHFQLFDSAGALADHAATFARPYHDLPLDGVSYGGMNFDQGVRAFRDGDLSGVARSDALLQRFESLTMPTSRKAWIDGVAGALPNVQAHLAGVPLAMRRKVRQSDDAAPLCVVIDIGAAAAIEPHEISNRGAAVLALVRILAIRRPVELWAGAILDADNALNASATFCRIDTSPLDLAHAAFILTHPAAIRRVIWGSAMAHGFKAKHPFLAGQNHAPFTRDLLATAFLHASDLLVMPRIRSGELSATDPTKWIDSQLAIYASDLEAA